MYKIKGFKLMFIFLLLMILGTGCAQHRGAMTSEEIDNENKPSDTESKQETVTDESNPFEIALKWGEPEIVTGDVKFGHDTSPDGRVATILFDDLNLSLDPNSGELDAMKIVKLRFPIVLPSGKKAGLIGFKQDIRGFIDKPNDATINIITDFAGTAKVFEYPYGSGIEQENVSSKESGTTESDSSGGVNIVGQFTHSSFSYMPVVPIMQAMEESEDKTTIYTATFLISVQRRSPDVGVLIFIDSLDIKVIFNAPPPTLP